MISIPLICAAALPLLRLDVPGVLLDRTAQTGAHTWLYGQFDKGLDEEKAKGWTVVNMEDDWAAIFPPDE